jgi:hypothetical protein
VELADEGGQEVARLRIEVVSRAVQIGGHEREVLGAVLPIETAAQLDAGDLGDSLGTVRLFERTGEKVFLFKRLRSEFRLDAGAPQEYQTLHARAECLMYDVELDRKVLLDELVGILPIGHDPADASRREDHEFRVRFGEEGTRLRLVGEVEFLVGPNQDVVITSSP